MTVSDALFARALDTMTGATLITDADQQILYANPAFVAATGYSLDEIIGCNCRILQDRSTDRATVGAIRGALGRGQAFAGDILNRRKDGSLFWNAITIFPIRDVSGALTHFVSVQNALPDGHRADGVLPQAPPEAPGPTSVDATVAASGTVCPGHPGGGAVEMFMQPIVDLRSGLPVVVETLARLRTPGGSIIAAADFVPLLDEAQLEALFREGLDQALASLAVWRDTGLDIHISVNLDPSTLLNPACASWIADALLRHGVEPELLTLELLETRTIARGDQSVAIDVIRALGVRLAIDDLGSGHSNLQRLTLFDFDVIKIDSSITANFVAAPIQTLSVVFALTQLSANLGRVSVVEGLETVDMVEMAAVLGADLGQGYYIAHPMPAVDFPEWATRAAPMIDAARVTTFAATLAYHWLFSRNSPHPGDLASCPVTPFLDDHPERDSVGGWHADQHGQGADSRKISAQKLTNWLVDRLS